MKIHQTPVLETSVVGSHHIFPGRDLTDSDDHLHSECCGCLLLLLQNIRNVLKRHLKVGAGTRAGARGLKFECNRNPTSPIEIRQKYRIFRR